MSRSVFAWRVPYLARGCRVVVTVPGGPMSAFDRSIGHRRHFTPDSLSQILRESGFRVESAQRAGFPFFNLYRLVVIARGEAVTHDVMAEARRPRRDVCIRAPLPTEQRPLAVRVADRRGCDPAARRRMTADPRRRLRPTPVVHAALLVASAGSPQRSRARVVAASHMRSTSRPTSSAIRKPRTSTSSATSGRTASLRVSSRS